MRFTASVPRCAVLALVAGVSAVAAQEPDLRFEVTSIKPRVIGSPQPAQRNSPNHFYRQSASVIGLVAYAYDINPLRVLDEPEWARTGTWEVLAKAERVPTDAEMRVMVRRMLEERTSLKARAETRELPIYELVVARRDGRLGPNLKRARFDCEPLMLGPVDRVRREAPIDPETGLSLCRPPVAPRGSFGADMLFTGMSLGRLAVLLESDLLRPVVDRTGLTGPFDVDLKFQPPDPLGRFLDERGLARPGLQGALEDQLGLKVVPSRGPVAVVVIDSIARPTPN